MLAELTWCWDGAYMGARAGKFPELSRKPQVMEALAAALDRSLVSSLRLPAAPTITRVTSLAPTQSSLQVRLWPSGA